MALRRLRSALRVYRPVLDADFARQAAAELKWIAQATGGARDWDVLATATLPALAKGLEDPRLARSLSARVARKRRAAREAMREALRSPRYARLVLLLARYLAEPPPKAAPGDAGLTQFAAQRLRKRYRKFRARARHLARLDPRERHRLRIEAKKLRYALDGFGALYPRKRVKGYLDTLADIQEDLGRANDATVGARLLHEIDLPNPVAQFARGWLDSQRHAAARRLERHFARLDAAPRFWDRA